MVETFEYLRIHLIVAYSVILLHKHVYRSFKIQDSQTLLLKGGIKAIIYPRLIFFFNSLGCCLKVCTLLLSFLTSFTILSSMILWWLQPKLLPTDTSLGSSCYWVPVLSESHPLAHPFVSYNKVRSLTPSGSLACILLFCHSSRQKGDKTLIEEPGSVIQRLSPVI